MKTTILARLNLKLVLATAVLVTMAVAEFALGMVYGRSTKPSAVSPTVSVVTGTSTTPSPVKLQLIAPGAYAKSRPIIIKQ